MCVVNAYGVPAHASQVSIHMLYSEIICRVGTECAIPTRSTTTTQSQDHAGSSRKVFRPTKTARAS